MKMAPFHKHINQVFRDLAFGKQRLEDLVERPARYWASIVLYNVIRQRQEMTKHL